MHTTKPYHQLKLLAVCLTIILASVIFARKSHAADASPWTLAFSLKDKSLNEALPTALHIDEEKKRYYVVDSFSGQLASFDDSGAFLKSFVPEGGLQNPFDMIRLNASTLVIAEKGHNSLTTIDFAQKKTTRKTITDQGQPLMVDRLEIVGDTLYGLDHRTGQIYQLSPSLAITKRFALPEESQGLVDFKIVGNQIWGLGQQEKRIYIYAENGRISKRIELDNLAANPVSFCVDAGGYVYVLDRHKARVIVLDRKTKFKYTFLSKGHGMQNLYFPMEIRFDPWGRLCIVDEGNSRVQVFKR